MLYYESFKNYLCSLFILKFYYFFLLESYINLNKSSFEMNMHSSMSKFLKTGKILWLFYDQGKTAITIF